MAKKGKKYKVVYSRLMAVVVLIVACVIVILLSGGQNRLKNVEVTCQNGVLTQEEKDEIIRLSSLKMGKQISSIAEIEASVKTGVDSTGFARFESIERISKDTVSIDVTRRQAICVVSANGNYVVIDREGMVMDVLNHFPKGTYIQVTGADITNYSKGKKLVLRKENQIQDIIRIAAAIVDMGYKNNYSEFNVKDEDDIYLVTNTNQMVEIFDAKNIEQTLQMVDEIIKKGHTDGKIIISGDYAGYRVDD